MAIDASNNKGYQVKKLRFLDENRVIKTRIPIRR